MNAAMESSPAVWTTHVRSNEPMSRHSSWRCGGPARTFFEPRDRAELREGLAALADEDDVLWLGLGSNLLVRDGGIDALVVSTVPGLNTLRWETESRVYAECGVTCARLARACAEHDRAGLEFLAGIPGSVGGALRMNAGAFGGETWRYVAAVETIDRAGRLNRYERDAFEPGYRSVRGPEYWFVGAWFDLPDSAGGSGARRIREVISRKGAAQPTGQASCGSVFKNPPGDFAGRLIEQAGLKGLAIGGCRVSDKHANFFINDGEASAADIEALIRTVQQRVAVASGIELEAEVQIVGQPPGEQS